LNIEGERLSEDKWAERFNQALWIEEYRLKLFAGLFKTE
jgi:hypothetical protein